VLDLLPNLLDARTKELRQLGFGQPEFE